MIFFNFNLTLQIIDNQMIKLYLYI